jgi:hypothetical protein
MTSWREFYIDAIEASAKGEGQDPLWDLTYYIMKLHNDTSSADSIAARNEFRESLTTPWVDPAAPVDTATDTDSSGENATEE